MERLVFAKQGQGDGSQPHHPPFFPLSSLGDVSYSCGSCGYELNLSSLNRITSMIGSKYSKSIKTGRISFFDVDESRFTLVGELKCIPHLSKSSWSFLRRRTKLLCRKCGNRIGVAYYESASSPNSTGSDKSSDTEYPGRRVYDVRIRALQPSSSSEASQILLPSFSEHDFVQQSGNEKDLAERGGEVGDDRQDIPPAAQDNYKTRLML